MAQLNSLFLMGMLIGALVALAVISGLWWYRQSRPKSDNGTLDWPEVEKPKNTEYRLTEDGELDGDFPVDSMSPPEPIPAEHAPGSLTYDKSKVDEYAGAQSSAWMLNPGYAPWASAWQLQMVGSGQFVKVPTTAFPTGTTYQEALRIIQEHNATVQRLADNSEPPPEPPPQEPGYTTLTR